MTGKVNVDFEDVKTVMTGSGVAIMGMAESEGETVPFEPRRNRWPLAAQRQTTSGEPSTCC